MVRLLGCLVKGLFMVGMIGAGVTFYQAVENGGINQVSELANTAAIWVIDHAFALLEYLSDRLSTWE